ncbi:MAG: gliding motility-associated C-terminal domain-containing protein, partial [Bacteroidota bacterium]
GKNDKWIIRGIKCFPSASITIFNRWGNLIYKAAPYNNDWDGRSDNSLTVSSGEQVPAGTYFYILDLGKGKRLTGSLYVAY